MNRFEEYYISDKQSLIPPGYKVIDEGVLSRGDFVWFGAVHCWLLAEIHFPMCLGVDVGVFVKVARKELGYLRGED